MTPEEIIGEVALVTGVPAPAITGRRRNKYIVHARFLAMAAVREAFGWWSLQMTADFFHREDHGTIINARARHLELLKTDPIYKAHATQIRRHLFACPSR